MSEAPNAADLVARGLDRATAEDVEEIAAQAEAERAKARVDALRTKPVAEMTASEVVRAPNPWPGGDYSSAEYRAATARHHQLTARKEEVEDEVAAARVLARKGLAPDPAWSRGSCVPSDEMRALERAVAADPHDIGAQHRLQSARARRGAAADQSDPDPRLTAWRKVVWERVGAALRELPDKHNWSGDWPDAPTFEAVSRIEVVLEQALRSIVAIRGQYELEKGL